MSACVGLDTHLEYTHATVIDEDGRVVKKGKAMAQQIPLLLEVFNLKKVGLEALTHITSISRSLGKKGYDVLVSHLKEKVDSQAEDQDIMSFAGCIVCATTTLKS